MKTEFYNLLGLPLYLNHPVCLATQFFGSLIPDTLIWFSQVHFVDSAKKNINTRLASLFNLKSLTFHSFSFQTVSLPTDFMYQHIHTTSGRPWFIKNSTATQSTPRLLNPYTPPFGIKLLQNTAKTMLAWKQMIHSENASKAFRSHHAGGN